MIVLGALFLLAVVLLAWLFLREDGILEQIVGSKYEKQQFINTPSHEAIIAVEYALKHCGFSLTQKDYEQKIINAEAPWTMKSFGERIQVILKSKENGTLIHFYSACKMPTQIIDWGKNKQNADKFFKVVDVIS